MTTRTMTTTIVNQMTSKDKAWAKCLVKKQAYEAALAVFENTKCDDAFFKWKLANAAYKRALNAYAKAAK